MIFRCQFIFSFFLVLVLCFSAFAQKDSTYLKHSIKTNVFQWGMNEANLCYEYRFNKSFGLETTIGTYMNQGKSFTFPLYEQIPLPYKGYILRINPKWYFNKNYVKNSEWYFSPMAFLKGDFVKGSAGHFSQLYDVEEKRWVYGSSTLLGYQRTIFSNINVDIYFGAGARYRNMVSAYSQVTANTRQHKPPANYAGGPYTVAWDEWQPSFHVGMKLGYGFPGLPSNAKSEADNNATYFKYSLSTNPVQSFMYNQNLSFEYRFSDKVGFVTTAGIYLLNKKREFRDADDGLLLSDFVSASVGPKIYTGITSKRNNTAFFISPTAIFQYKKEISGNIVSDKENIAGVDILSGIQKTRGHFLVDLYTGLRLHNNTIHYTYQNNTIIINRTYNEWKPAFLLGIKLGYGFKSIK